MLLFFMKVLNKKYISILPSETNDNILNISDDYDKTGFRYFNTKSMTLFSIFNILT